MYVDSRVTTLSDGVDHEVLNHSVLNVTGPMTMAAADLFHGYGYGNVPGTKRSAGIRYVSHFLQASWDTDEGQWIGPAVEVEGTGTAPPLEAPILLE